MRRDESRRGTQECVRHGGLIDIPYIRSSETHLGACALGRDATRGRTARRNREAKPKEAESKLSTVGAELAVRPGAGDKLAMNSEVQRSSYYRRWII